MKVRVDILLLLTLLLSHVGSVATPAESPALPPQVEAHMQEMLTRWSLTTVWDLGSVPDNTLALRHRIEAGDIAGLQILMAGDIFPQDGPPELQIPPLRLMTKGSVALPLVF
jgi:hypothetical protein